MKIQTTTLALALSALLGAVPLAHAHTAFVDSDAVAGKSFFATLNIGHGCEDQAGIKYDTERLEVEIPASVSELNSIRPMDAPWAAASVVKDANGNITKLVWTKTDAVHSEDSQLYRVSFTAKLPNTPMTSLAFPAIQYCTDSGSNEITAEWIGAESPTLRLSEAHKSGWNKYTAQIDIDEATIKAFFANALIVWSGGTAYSSNPVTDSLITNKLTTISTGSEFWVKY